MTKLDLDAIERRAEAATPGPWVALDWEKVNGGTDWDVWGPKGTNHIGDDDLSRDFGSEDDAKFIAHAREDIPALIKEVRRLRGAISERKWAIDYKGLYCFWCGTRNGQSHARECQVWDVPSHEDNGKQTRIAGEE